MKKYLTFLVVAVLTVLSFSFLNYESNYYTTVLPLNAAGTGTIVTPATFATWLPSGTVPATDVFVKPADGLTFTDNPNLDFYRWTEQMFLWLLSPVPATGGYGSCSGLVLNSPEFYDVSQIDATGTRTLTKHFCSGRQVVVLEPISLRQINAIDTEKSMSFSIKGRSNGSKNLPILFEKETKKMFDVDKTPKSKDNYQLIYNSNFKETEIGKIKIVKNTPQFYDLKNNLIKSPSLILTKGLDADTTIQQFSVGNTTISLAQVRIGIGISTIIIIAPEQGQSTGDVLMTRSGSLIYYNQMVNDVYAVFLTMVKNHVLSDTAKFPTTQAELTQITDYATLKNIPIVEPNSLAMELKSSWVETTNISNIADYVTIKATVPNYIQSSTSVWTQNGTKVATLALLGLHVVGSVKNHPEMIWGSIEHIGNTPNRTYTYRTTSGTNTTVSADTNSPWLFSDPNAINFNESHMTMNGTDIQALAPHSISPSNTERTKPFGYGTQANGAAGTINSEAISNAQVIATNKDVNDRLVGNDVRKKYFHIGSTWNAFAPSVPSVHGKAVGTNQLSNSTMETYTQFISGSPNPLGNCFNCHTSNNGQVNRDMPQLTFLTHIFNSYPLVP